MKCRPSRQLEQDQLDEMWSIVLLHPSELDTIEPAQLGFVCSARDWKLYIKRQLLLGTAQTGSDNFPPRINSREILRQAAWVRPLIASTVLPVQNLSLRMTRSRRSASHTYGHYMRERHGWAIKRPPCSKPLIGWLVCVLLAALSLCAPLLAAERRSDTVYTATAYSDSGKTASGEYTHRHVVAADPDILPLGSRIRIRRAGRYSGEYVVADTGGKILGKRLDIYLPSEAKAKKFGVRKVRVKVLELGDNTRAKTKQSDAVVKQDVAKEVAKNAEGSAATEDDIAAKNAREKKAAAEKTNSGGAPDLK